MAKALLELEKEHEQALAQMQVIRQDLDSGRADLRTLPAMRERLQADLASAQEHLRTVRAAGAASRDPELQEFYASELTAAEREVSRVKLRLAPLLKLDPAAIEASVKSAEDRYAQAEQKLSEATVKLADAKDSEATAATRKVLQAYQQFLEVLASEGESFSRLDGSSWWSCMDVIVADRAELLRRCDPVVTKQVQSDIAALLKKL